MPRYSTLCALACQRVRVWPRLAETSPQMDRRGPGVRTGQPPRLRRSRTPRPIRVDPALPQVLAIRVCRQSSLFSLRLSTGPISSGGRSISFAYLFASLTDARAERIAWRLASAISRRSRADTSRLAVMRRASHAALTPPPTTRTRATSRHRRASRSARRIA